MSQTRKKKAKTGEPETTRPKLKQNEVVDTSNKFSQRYRVTNGKKFSLADYDPGSTGQFGDADKPRSKEALTVGIQALADLQDVFYANREWSLLLIFQAMDAAGKDGVIKHVMSGVNPQGCQVASFKTPSAEDLDHDYLWRCQEHLPERGRIGIFNRSYYEEVLVVKVHKEVLQAQRLPKELITPKIWKNRYEDIRAFEQHLANNGTIIRKFFLNVSHKEQRRRFLERLNDSSKNWKFSASDMKESGYWDSYSKAYEKMIRETATKDAPWYVVPADNKWYTRIIVAAAIVDALGSLKLKYPTVDQTKLEQLAEAKRELMKEKG
jgi:PPK2 family polyphosphate:nucleotide phosphotransferase